MIKLEVERTIKGEPAQIRFSNADYEKAGHVVVTNSRANVERQIQVTGAALKRNRSSTLRRKRAEGKPPLALVDTEQRGKFRKKAGYAVSLLRDGASVTFRNLSVATDVQRKGYVGWFGLSPRGRELVWAVFRRAIDRARKKAKKARRRETYKG